MRIGIDARMADWTGVGRYTRGLLRGLTAIDKNNDYFLIANHISAHLLPVADNFSMIEADSPVMSLAGFREVGRLASKAKVDIFHALHFPVPLGYRGKIAVTLHDLIPLDYPAAMPGFARRLVYAALNRRAVRRSNVIITDSGYTADRVEARYPKAKDKIKVVHLGIEKSFFKPPETFSIALEADNLFQAPFILSMGNQKAHKNLIALVEAFAKLAASKKFNHKLVLVGEPDNDHPQVLQAVKKNNLQEKIIFYGEATDAELISLYRKADLFVFPSLYEGFGFPPLEAMASGVPVVCSNRASLPEVCGQGGLLVEPNAEELGKAIDLVLNNAELRSQMILKGKEQAQKFSWENTALQTLKLYRSTVGK